MGLSSLKIVEVLILVALVADVRSSSASICSSNTDILTASSGSLKSPNFPNHYPHNTTKVWKIMAPEGERITLQFHTFNLESHSSQCKVQCGCDYVKVRNKCDAAPIEALCGSIHPVIFTSAGNEMWVEFRSDLSVNHTGFLALYTRASMSCPRPGDNPSNSDYCLKNGKVQCCNRDFAVCRYDKLLSNLNGTFTSPRYPSEYPSGTVYKWRITVPQGYLVQVNFTKFQTQMCALSCSCDLVTVRYGPCNFYGGHKACGLHSKGLSYTSKDRHMFVTFVSNSDSIRKTGFSANYRIALKCTGAKPISCVIDGKPSCCSTVDAAVTCSDSRALQRSNCRERKVCCITKGVAGCCDKLDAEVKCTGKGSEDQSHCKYNQVCCIVNGSGQCCSKKEAAVRCFDGSSQRSHCPEGKLCCKKNGTQTCCDPEPVKCTDIFSSQRSQCAPGKICCIEKSVPKCCSPVEAAVRCHDSGQGERSHCPQNKKCCTTTDHKPACCSSGERLKSWPLLITILTVALMLVQHPRGSTN